MPATKKRFPLVATGRGLAAWGIFSNGRTTEVLQPHPLLGHSPKPLTKLTMARAQTVWPGRVVPARLFLVEVARECPNTFEPHEAVLWAPRTEA